MGRQHTEDMFVTVQPPCASPGGLSPLACMSAGATGCTSMLVAACDSLTCNSLGASDNFHCGTPPPSPSPLPLAARGACSGLVDTPVVPRPEGSLSAAAGDAESILAAPASPRGWHHGWSDPRKDGCLNGARCCTSCAYASAGATRGRHRVAMSQSPCLNCVNVKTSLAWASTLSVFRTCHRHPHQSCCGKTVSPHTTLPTSSNTTSAAFAGNTRGSTTLVARSSFTQCRDSNPDRAPLLTAYLCTPEPTMPSANNHARAHVGTPRTLYSTPTPCPMPGPSSEGGPAVTRFGDLGCAACCRARACRRRTRRLTFRT